MVKLVEMKRTVMPSDIIVKLLCVGTADDKIQIFASCLSIGERKGKTQGRVAGRYNDIMGTSWYTGNRRISSLNNYCRPHG